MTPQVPHHEFLLLTNTHFAQKQFCGNNHHNSSGRSVEKQLERACWNGMVLQLLPDLVEHSSRKKPAYAWEVIPAENFIEIRLGETPHSVEYTKSVNPYFFLFETNFN